MKIHTSHSPRMRYKTCTFACNPSTITGNLLGGQYAFRAYLSASTRGIFLKIHISHSPRMRSGIWVAIGQ